MATDYGYGLQSAATAAAVNPFQRNVPTGYGAALPMSQATALPPGLSAGIGHNSYYTGPTFSGDPSQVLTSNLPLPSQQYIQSMNASGYSVEGMGGNYGDSNFYLRMNTPPEQLAREQAQIQQALSNQSAFHSTLRGAGIDPGSIYQSPIAAHGSPALGAPAQMNQQSQAIFDQMFPSMKGASGQADSLGNANPVSNPGVPPIAPQRKAFGSPSAIAGMLSGSYGGGQSYDQARSSGYGYGAAGAGQTYGY